MTYLQLQEVLSTNPVTAEQEPERLQLTDIHGCGLKAVTKMPGEFPA